MTLTTTTLREREVGVPRPRRARPSARRVRPSTGLRPGSRNRVLELVPVVALLCDAALLATAVGLAMWGRQEVQVFPGQWMGPQDLTAVAPLILVGWLVCVHLFGGYERDVFGAGTDEYRRVINASFLAASMLGVSCYLLRYPLPRAFFVIAFVVGIPLLVAGRLALRRTIHHARRRGRLLHRVAIAGSPCQIDEIAGVLARQPWLGYDVVAALTPPTEYDECTPAGLRVWGNSDDVAWVVETAGADTLFITGGAFRSASQMRQAIWDLEKHDVQVVVAPSVTDVARERVRVRPIGGLPLIHLDRPQHFRATRSAKRIFDLVGSSLLLVAFAPLLAVAAARIWWHDRGPVIFRQVRVGRDGAEFSCLKFRTMVQDAEAMLAALHAQAGHDGGLFKMKDDPRITKPGRWLRRLSLDELPQLINVWRGDMSLVGPRPPLVDEVAAYDDATRRRLRVRPGMTGLWQVSGRSDLSFSEAIRLDLYYVDNWSMVQDLTILFRTLSAVLRSRGAY